MDALGGLWGFGVVLIGGFFLGGVILWSMYKNRQEPQEEIDRTEEATRANYAAQDAQDKRDDARN